MILLTVVAVGLLTLSTISLRSATHGKAISEARANARMAMMIALGELQTAMGPDQAVSAPASAVIVNGPRPHLMGTWKSWRWTPTPGGSPTYGDKKGRFKRWLISAADDTKSKTFSYGANQAPTGANGVRLVGQYQNSQNVSTEVIAEKITVASTTQSGKLAWVVFDESIKAPIDLADPDTVPTVGEEIASRTVPPRVRADILDVAKLASLKKPENLISLETAAIPLGIAGTDEVRRRIHDFTVGSMGLLTNTADGGFKLDLTQLFEAADLPVGAFSEWNPRSPYPETFPAESSAPTWQYLRDHYRKYKDVSATSGVARYSPAPETDLKIESDGRQAAPDSVRLLPVIAKAQIFFSLAARFPETAEARTQLDKAGNPKGFNNYKSIWLAMNPAVTLFNPYDVALDLDKLRIRIWDPPIAFRFSKKDMVTGGTSYLHQDQEKFLKLGQFEWMNGNFDKDEARESVTLVLNDSVTSGGLKLLPGEVKVFSFRYKAGESLVNAIYDDNTDRQFDDRSGLGKFGVVFRPGWNTATSLDYFHLVNGGRRAPDSYYSFERKPNDYAIVRNDDRIIVEAKPIVASGKATAHFQVDILAGKTQGSINSTADYSNSGVSADTLRSYRFIYHADPSAELSAYPDHPVITRDFKPSDIEESNKKPFAVVELSARSTKDDLTDSKPWLYNNCVVEGGDQKTSEVGLVNQSYDVRVREVASFDSFPGVEFDPDTNRAYFGASSSASEGSNFVPMFKVAQAPAASLGDLIPSNLIAGSELPRVVHAFGNSWAHPLVPAGKVSVGTSMLDHSYLLNDSLWDRYYFSSLTGTSGGILGESQSIEKVMTGVLDGSISALNARMTPVGSAGDPKGTAQMLAGLSDEKRSLEIAGVFGVEGAFNVNSTSVDAWRSVLSSLRDREINGLKRGSGGFQETVYSSKDLVPVVRMNRPLSDQPFDGQERWGAFRSLDDDQIRRLAEFIVKGISERGVLDGAPSLSLGEFVNRRIGDSSDKLNLEGILQAAIDKSGINDQAIQADSKTIDSTTIPVERKVGTLTDPVLNGNTAEGAPTMLTQGDLMMALAPVATVRGDTFKIRSYGEAVATNGTTILARVWCEAIVQRVPDFVDPGDSPATAVASLDRPANKLFGRRFEIVSFRWLGEGEL